MCNVVHHWYQPKLTWLTILLIPFSWLFRLVVKLRKCLLTKLRKPYRSKLPVVIVGNLTVGGTGKTPLVIYLVNALRAKGFNPGVVMRGYGGLSKGAVRVTHKMNPQFAGDEAVLLFNKLGCPIIIGRNRVDSIKMLESQGECDIVISDDGLQHYAIARDVEILVIDGMRRLGNGAMLPAGPLREPINRLASVDIVATNGEPMPGEIGMHLKMEEFVSVKDPSITKPLDYFKSKSVHALAGVGNPARFFKALDLLGVTHDEHIFPDHHPFVSADIDLDGDVVMTEKDAIKCRSFADDRHWYLRVSLDVDAMLIHTVLTLIKRREK